MSALVLGIDPGWSGGAALLGEDGNLIDVQSFARMTEADIIDAVTVMIHTAGSCACYLEKVNAFPGQGVCSSFKFGMIYGLLRGLVIGECRVIDVTPQKWQKALGCMSRGDKNVTKAKAQQLFPGVKVTHAIADSLLLAYYGHLQERNPAAVPDGRE